MLFVSQVAFLVNLFNRESFIHTSHRFLPHLVDHLVDPITLSNEHRLGFTIKSLILWGKIIPWVAREISSCNQ